MPPKKSGRKNKRSASAATTTATGDKDNKNSKPDDDKLPVAGSEQGGDGDEHAAKRAKTTTAVLEGSDSRAAAALENDAFEKISKMLTLTLPDKKTNEGGEREAGQGEGVRKVIGGVEVGMGRRHHGSFFYDSGGGGGKVQMEWRLVREGDTERKVSASALRSQPVSSLTSSSSSSSSSSFSSSSSSAASSSFAQASTPRPWRLQLKYQLLRKKERSIREDEQEEEDQEEVEEEEESDFVPYPLPGSSEEKRMIGKRERKARKAQLKTIHQLEEAIKNNVIELHRITDDESTAQEDIMAVGRELQFLKAKLREHKAPEAEARYELTSACSGQRTPSQLADPTVWRVLRPCPSMKSTMKER